MGDTLYNFAPDLDEDITSTQAHLGATETKLQHKWVIEDVQLDEQSDPICSSAGCWKSEYTKQADEKIVQYPDPSDLDEDVDNTLAHETLASKKVGHTWNV